jgi:hypothetical protein
MLVKDLLKEKKFPKWFANHPIFKETSKISKVFPGIGLPNCFSEIEIDNSKVAAKAAAAMLSAIITTIKYNKTRIKTVIDGKLQIPLKQSNGLIKKVYSKLLKKKTNNNISFNDLEENTQNKINQCYILFSEVNAQLSKAKNKVITHNNGRITLNLVDDIRLYKDDKAPTYRMGESLFRVYNKLNQLLLECNLPQMCSLETFPTFKKFSTENVPNHKFKIVFSSDGVDGAWDIATMSMRGISSCQSWGGGYSHCLIGSVSDPFVGIVYLTSGGKFNDYGSKMMRRCVVRFVIDAKTRKPLLLLDNMYPAKDTQILKSFIDFLKEKTNNKFAVVYVEALKDSQELYLPLTKFRDKLRKYTPSGGKTANGGVESVASYQDFHIKDAKGLGRDKQAYLYDKNSEKKKNIFVKKFKRAMKEAIEQTDIENVPNVARPIISAFKGKDNFNYSHTIPAIANIIAEDIASSVNKDDFTNSDTYSRRIYYNYFNHKSKYCDRLKTKLAREFNSQLKLKSKIKGANVPTIIQCLLPKMDIIMKEKLKKLVEKRQEKYSGPLALP